jgi:hypothetical protein
MLAQHLLDEIGRIAGDFRHRRAPRQLEAILAIDAQADLRAPHGIEREAAIEKRTKGPIAVDALLSLAFDSRAPSGPPRRAG